MRNFLLLIWVACSSWMLQARTVDGIRIDAGDCLVLVYLNGEQVSLPTSSCFIANLSQGNYILEVYEANASRPYRRHHPRKLLYRQNVRYEGHGIKDILVDVPEHGSFPSYPNGNTPCPDESFWGGMAPEVFNRFLKDLKEETFFSDQKRMIDSAVITARFTSSQCAKIIEICDFDSERLEVMKKLYPAVVDKQNFIVVLNSLDFDSSKSTMNRFIKEYHKR